MHNYICIDTYTCAHLWEKSNETIQKFRETLQLQLHHLHPIGPRVNCHYPLNASPTYLSLLAVSQYLLQTFSIFLFHSLSSSTSSSHLSHSLLKSFTTLTSFTTLAFRELILSKIKIWLGHVCFLVYRGKTKRLAGTFWLYCFPCFWSRFPRQVCGLLKRWWEAMSVHIDNLLASLGSKREESWKSICG